MPAKRSRCVRSSSQGEIRVLDCPSSPPEFIDMHKPPPAAKCHRTSGTANKSASVSPESERVAPKSVLALASPDRKEEDEIDRRIGGFLEMCLFCKRRLTANDNLYMYRSVHAFCSPDCRDKHILADKEKVPGDSTRRN